MAEIVNPYGAGEHPGDVVADDAPAAVDAAAASPSGESGAPIAPAAAPPAVPGVHLPAHLHRFYGDRQLNSGFAVPEFLRDPTALAEIQPPTSVKTLEQRKAELTDDQRKAFGEFLRIARSDPAYAATLAAEAHDDGTPGPGGAGPPVDDEWRILRYLTARGFNVKKACDMLHATLVWERQIKPASLVCRRCVTDTESHCQEFVGWDLQHRPVMYSSYAWARAATRNNSDDAINHNVALMHRLTKGGLMPEGVEQWVVLTDFVTYSMLRDATSKVGIVVMQCLQNHYPERLGAQLLIDPPSAFWVMYKAALPFLDERTKAKVHFCYTEAEPRIDAVFAQLFPPHLAAYLCRTFRHNKASGGRK